LAITLVPPYQMMPATAMPASISVTGSARSTLVRM